MNKKNKGFTTIELITSFTLASVIMIILFNIILILKDNLSEVNAKTNMLVNKDNLSYNINKRFKEKEISSITTCEDGDKCYLFTYSDDTSDKLIYSNTDKSITFNNYTFDIIDGITVEEPTITEHYDTMSSTKYNGYFIIHIPIKIDDKDYSIKINKHFNTDSLVIDVGNYYYDNYNNRYTVVEYLESTGTQYIDTEIDAIKDRNYKIIYDIIVPETEYGFFGANGILQVLANNGEYYITKEKPNTNTSIQTNIRHTVISEGYYSDNSVNTSLTIDNTMVSAVWNSPMNGKGEIILYGLKIKGNISYKVKMTLYGCKIYDNDTLVRDYIPVIDSSERPCLFDKVEKKCYYNQGTGEFLYE